MCKFNPDRAKAFSFFGTIVKRYFIKQCIDMDLARHTTRSLDSTEDFHINPQKYSTMYYEDETIGDNLIEKLKLYLKIFKK